MQPEYEKDRKIDTIRRAERTAPIYFTLNTSVPLVGPTIALVYDKDGKYLGWCSEATIRGYLYGKLYYKTGGKYSIKGERGRYKYDGHKYVNEKLTGKRALTIFIKELKPEELTDLAIPANKAKILLAEVESGHNIRYVSDPNGFLAGFAERIQRETQELEKKFHDEAVSHLKGLIAASENLDRIALLKASRLNQQSHENQS